jgi:hypothetical protein
LNIMGISVRGGVELTHNPDNCEPWFDVVNISPMVNRRKEALYLLWGYGGRSIEFEPIADSRGLPSDVATDLRQRFENSGKYADGANYVTLEELRDVDWESNTSDTDSICWMSRPRTDQLGTPVNDIESLDVPASELERLNTEGAVEYENDRGVEYALQFAEPTRKRYCRTGGWWWIVDELMEHFAELAYEPEGVRLVVWMVP